MSNLNSSPLQATTQGPHCCWQPYSWLGNLCGLWVPGHWTGSSAMHQDRAPAICSLGSRVHILYQALHHTKPLQVITAKKHQEWLSFLVIPSPLHKSCLGSLDYANARSTWTSGLHMKSWTGEPTLRLRLTPPQATIITLLCHSPSPTHCYYCLINDIQWDMLNQSVFIFLEDSIIFSWPQGGTKRTLLKDSIQKVCSMLCWPLPHI